MLSIRDLRIDPACLGKKILVDIAPFYVYTPEKKRTDVIQGYRYTVALPDLHLEKISVKIDGNQLIEKADGYPEVEFNGFEMRAYQDERPLYRESGERCTCKSRQEAVLIQRRRRAAGGDKMIFPLQQDRRSRM